MMTESKKSASKNKELVGVVVSNKMESTVKVQIETPLRHPVYRKLVSYRKSYFARTNIELAEGDTVLIRETRPISKNVRWVVIEKVN